MLHDLTRKKQKDALGPCGKNESNFIGPLNAKTVRGAEWRAVTGRVTGRYLND